MPGKTTTAGQTLSKAERLTRTRLIGQVYDTGEVLKTPAILLIYRFMELPVTFPAQVMITAAKRNFRHAHDRNRIKRLIREAYRKNKSGHYLALEKVGKQAGLIFIFTGRQLPDSEYVNEKINSLLQRFTQLVLTHHLQTNEQK